MDGITVKTIRLSSLLLRIQTCQNENAVTDVSHNLFRKILHVLLSYVDWKSLIMLVGASRGILRNVILSKIPIPLSVSVKRDIDDGLLLAKSKLDALISETNLDFSLHIFIRSKGKWGDDVDLLVALDSYITPQDNAGHTAAHVKSFCIEHLYVELKEIHEALATYIRSMENLKILGLRGYICKNVQTFQEYFVPNLTARSNLRVLEQVEVNLYTLAVLPPLFKTSKLLTTLKLCAIGADDNREKIFSILSALPGTLERLSVSFLHMKTEEESAQFLDFVREQPRLSNLSLSSCGVSGPACKNFCDLLKQTQLTKLKLDSLHMAQDKLCGVLKQIGDMTQLKRLRFTRTHCTETNTKIFCSGLRNITSLQRLDLSYLSLGAHSVSELAAALTNLQRLQQLDLSENRFGNVNVSPLVRVLTEFSMLTRLRLHNCGMTKGVREQMKPILPKQI
jgi:Leucine-rich repeat (LRR) protein